MALPSMELLWCHPCDAGAQTQAFMHSEACTQPPNCLPAPLISAWTSHPHPPPDQDSLLPAVDPPASRKLYLRSRERALSTYKALCSGLSLWKGHMHREAGTPQIRHGRSWEEIFLGPQPLLLLSPHSPVPRAPCHLGRGAGHKGCWSLVCGAEPRMVPPSSSLCSGFRSLVHRTNCSLAVGVGVWGGGHWPTAWELAFSPDFQT